MADADLPGVLPLDPYQSVININWGGGQFLLVGTTFTDGAWALASTNGLDWVDVSRFFPSEVGLSCGAYGEGVWIFGGYIGESFGLWRTTSDFDSFQRVWTSAEQGPGSDIPKSIAYGKPKPNPNEPPPENPPPGIFVATVEVSFGAFLPKGGAFLTSKDLGLTWSVIPPPDVNDKLREVRFFNDAFMAASSGEENDGSGGHITPAGGGVYRSVNGTSWTRTTVISDTITVPLGEQSYTAGSTLGQIGYDKTVGKYAAIGNAPDIMVVFDLPHRIVHLKTFSSGTGTAWAPATQFNNHSYGVLVNGLVSNNNGVFCACGHRLTGNDIGVIVIASVPGIFRSETNSDGDFDWHFIDLSGIIPLGSTTSTTGMLWGSIEYNAGRFVAYGACDNPHIVTIVTSTDGLEWEIAYSETSTKQGIYMTKGPLPAKFFEEEETA
jgi:hypothetical protein